MKKLSMKALAWLLVLCMMLSIVPVNAFATDEIGSTDGVETSTEPPPPSDDEAADSSSATTLTEGGSGYTGGEMAPVAITGTITEDAVWNDGDIVDGVTIAGDVTITVNGTVTVTGTIRLSPDVITNVVFKGSNDAKLIRDASFTGQMFYAEGVSGNFQNLTFNNVTLDGGAVWTGDVDKTLNRGTTNSGVKATGSVLYLLYANATLENGSVLQNHDDSTGNKANAVFLRYYSTLTVNDSVVRNNNGISTYYRGGVVTVRQGGTVKTDNADVYGNSGASGGFFGISSTGSYGGIADVKNSKFHNNYADNGAVFLMQCNSKIGYLSIDGCEFYENASKTAVLTEWAYSRPFIIKDSYFHDNECAVWDCHTDPVLDLSGKIVVEEDADYTKYLFETPLVLTGALADGSSIAMSEASITKLAGAIVVGTADYAVTETDLAKFVLPEGYQIFLIDVTGDNIDDAVAVELAEGATLTEVTLTAKDSLDAEASATQKVYAEIECMPANPFAHEGLIFAGWVDANGNAVAKQMFTEATTLTATWKIETPVVKLSRENATLKATVTNAYDVVTYTYQWYKDDVAIDGATASTYTMTDINSASYKCVVTASVEGLASVTGSAKGTSSAPAVAQVGETKYATLAEAITAANAVVDAEGNVAPATVTLLRDITLGEKLTISGNVTISGEYTITRADNNYTGTLFAVSAGATLTLDGGLVIDGGNEYVFDKEAYEADLADWENPTTESTKWFTPEEGAPVATAYMITTAGTLNLNDVSIKNHYSTNGSGIVSASKGAIVTLDGAQITHNASTSGSGLVVNASAGVWSREEKLITVTMNEGTVIDGNHVGGNHGIFKIYQGTYFTMNGGEIKNTTGWNSNGVAVGIYHAVFTMNGGTICSNSSEYGPNNGRNAAIYGHSNHLFIMNGGTICHNTGRSKAGIDSPYSETGSTGQTFINGGSVLANTVLGTWSAPDVSGGATLTITGGTFTQDVSQWLAPDTGLVYDEANGTYTTTDHVYNLYFRDPTTGEQVAGVGPLQGNDPADLVATGKLFYADYYDMELEVLSNAKVDDTIVIDYPMTVNLNGYTLTGAAKDGVQVYPVIRVQGGANVTVKNGTINNEDYVFVLGASDGSSAGNLTIESGKFHGATTVASVTKGTLTILGGEFSVTESDYGSTYLLNCIDANYKDGSAAIVVKGGSFVGFNPADNTAEGAGTTFVAEGYISETKDEGATYTVRVLNYVAEVNGVKYESLKEALEACTNGETVKLIADIVYDADDVVYAHGGATGFGKYDRYNPSIIYIGGTKGATAAENQPSKVNAVLDLNGHSITNSADAYLFLFMDNCKVTFKDSVGTGSVTNTGENYPVIWVCGTDTLVTIESGKYVTASKTGVLHSTHAGDLVITGGEFMTTAEDASLLIMLNTQPFNNPNNFLKGVATVTISGGIFHGFDPSKVGDDYGASSTEDIKFVSGVANGYVAKDQGDGTWGVAFAVRLYLYDPITGEPATVPYLEGMDIASVVALGKAFYDDYYDMKLVLLNDFETSTSIVIDYPMTIDLGGHTITGAKDADGVQVYPVIRVQGGANVTVKNGTINNEDYVFVLGASDGSSAGNLTIESGSYTGETTVASVTKGTLTILGGEFSVTESDYGSTYLLNCIDANYKDGSAAIVVKGGSFVGFNPADNTAEGANTDFVPWGYEATQDGDVYTVAPADEFIIMDADDMLAFAAMVNGGNKFAGKVVKLGADIDLTGIAWAPIGGDSVYFAGEFDGQGYTIKNLTQTTGARMGLFGLVEKAYIHDFTMENVNLVVSANNARVGAIAGNLQYWNVVENVTIDGITITMNGNDGLVGSVAGYVWKSQMGNVDVKNANITINGTGNVFGGNTGYGRAHIWDTGVTGNNANWLDGSVQTIGGTEYVLQNYWVDCDVDDITITINGNGNEVGGFFGSDTYNSHSNYFVDCHVTALEVNVAEGTSQIVGGFIAWNNGTTSAGTVKGFDGCSVSGTINGANGTYGGFVGQVGGRACEYYNGSADVDITCTGIAGGFVGITQAYSTHKYTFTECVANGDVTGTVAGGFAGKNGMSGDGKSVFVTYENCSANGTVTATSIAGGFIGEVNTELPATNWNTVDSTGDLTLTNNVASKNVTGAPVIGYLIGYLDGVANGDAKEGNTLKLNLSGNQPDGSNVGTGTGHHINISGDTIVNDIGVFVASVSSADGNVTYYGKLEDAIAAAQDGDTVTLLTDIDYGTVQLAIDKAITLDLGGHTLTTRNAYGGMSLKNGPSIKNGTIVHASNTAAIKAWNVGTIENVVIDVQGKGDANKTIGGIVLQENCTGIGTLKNVTIKGVALTNGIQTNNCGNATSPVIGSMENVTIDAKGAGMLISAPCGTATNCSIKGGVSGIEIWIKGTYSAILDLKGCTVEGGQQPVYAHDEFNSTPGIVNNGTLKLTIDDNTTLVNENGVVMKLTIARAENVDVNDVIDRAVVKMDDVYYATIKDALATLKSADTTTHVVTVLKDHEIDVNYSTYNYPILVNGFSIELDLNGKTITADWSKYTGDRVDNALICVANGGKLTVTDSGGDGKIVNNDTREGVDNRIFWIMTSTADKSIDVNINGGTFIQNDVNTALLYIQGNKPSDNLAPLYVNINGGYFESVNEDFFNAYDGYEKTAYIYGGTFSHDPTDWEIKIHPSCYLMQNADGTYSVKPGAVASINNVGYASFADAYAAAKDGDIITLLTDVTEAGVKINKSITIDFGGHTYTFTSGVGSTGTSTNGFQILKNNTVVLKDGKLTVAEADAAKFYILIQNYADLTVSGMTLDGTYLDKYAFTDGDSYVLSNNNGNIVIENTEITANDNGDKAFAFDVCDSASYAGAPTVTMKDDCVINGNIEITGASKLYAVEGLTNVTTPDADYKVVYADAYIVVAKVYVAEVNGVKYESLQEAVNAANADATVKLLADVTITESIQIAADDEITLDLNGKALTNEIPATASVFHTIVNNGTLTVIDSVGGGSIESNANKGYVIYTEGGNLTVKGAKIVGLNQGYALVTWTNGDTITIEDGTVVEGRGALYVDGGATAVVNGGTFTMTVQTTNNQDNVVYVGGTSELTINGGTFSTGNITGTQRIAIAALGTSKVTINGGSFYGLTGDIQVKDSATVNVSNGTFTGKKMDRRAGTLSLTGGTYSYDPTTWVADGYKAVDNGDGTYTVEEDIVVKFTCEIIIYGPYTGTYTAQFNSSMTLAEMLESVKKTYSRIYKNIDITLLGNVNAGELVFDATVPVKLEGGEFTLSGNFTVAEGTELVIQSGTYTFDVNEWVAEDKIAKDNGNGTWTVVDYVEWIKAELLAGNDVTLMKDITITDYDLVNALKLPSNGNGKYTEVHGNGAVFHVIKPGVVFDLNGHSITWDAHHDDYCNKRQVSLFMVTITGNSGDTSDLTIKDSSANKTGKVEVYGMGTGMYVVGVDAKATISGGTWTNYPCKTCGASNIFLYPSHGGELHITDGTFEQKDSEYLLGWKGSSKPTNNNGVGTDYDATKVVITGGTFVGFNPEEVKFFDTANSGQETINGCAEGFASLGTSDGTWTVKPLITVTFDDITMVNGNELPEFTYTTNFTEVAEDGTMLVVEDPVVTVNGVGQYTITANAYVFMNDDYAIEIVPGTLTVKACVATVDGVAYDTWADAKAAIKGDSTIVLYDDITNSDSFSPGAMNKICTLDLNGHTFTTKTIGVNNHVTLRITDSGEGGSVNVTDYTGLYVNGYLNVDSDVNFNSTLRINYHTAEEPSTGCFMVDGIKWIGRGHFSLEDGKIGTTGAYVRITDGFMNIAFTSGRFLLNASIETLAGQSISVGENASLTVPENVTLTLAPTTMIAIDGTVTGDGTVVVNSFDQLKAILTTEVTNIAIGSAITVSETLTIEKDVTITGMANVNANDNLTLKAGTYDMDVYAYCAEGYAARNNGDGTWTVAFGVVKNTTTGKLYANLADAVAEAVTGDTIKLLSDITVTQTIIRGDRPAIKITIDLGGHTITSSEVAVAAFRDGTEVTFTNGTVSGNSTGGTLKATYDGTIILGDNITVVSGGQANAIYLDGGKLIVGDAENVVVTGGIGCLTTKGGTANTIEIASGNYTGAITINEESTCTLTGGTFTQDVNEYCADGYYARNNGDGTWTVVEKFAIDRFRVVFANSFKMDYLFNSNNVADWTDYYVEIERTYANGSTVETVKISASDWLTYKLNGVTYYMVSYDKIAAKEMNDIVKVTVYDKYGVAISTARETSIKDYAMGVLNTEGDNYRAMDTLVVDMLNYGAAAQLHFGYDAENLVNADLTVEQQSLATPSVEYKNSLDSSADTVGAFYASRVVFKSNISFQIAILKSVIDVESSYAVFTYTDHYGEPQEVTVSAETFTMDGDYYVVSLDKLVVSDARQLVNCTIYNGDGTIATSVSDSMESYVARAEGTRMEDLAVSFLKFADSAHAYLHLNDK